MFAKTSFVAAALASLANGHMLMNTPTPYSTPALANGPLEADGSNFPCQLTSGESLSGSASNTYALGSTQELKFTGQAVHGGGSCQVSITYDSNPSSSSTWKAITSIEGGCPAQGQSGNMGSDASAEDPYTYNFTIPSDIPTGSVTLAWTWFNKIGNREMYMNCAPVTLTGTSGSESNFDSLPDMFTANIGNGCGTVDSTDLLFPNPGSEVQSLNGATSAFSTPTGTGCQAAGASATGGSSDTTTTAAAASSAATSAATSAVTSAATSATTDSGAAASGGIFVTKSTSTTAAAAGTTTAAAAGTTTAAAAGTTTTAAAAGTTSAAAAAGTGSATTSAAASTGTTTSTSGTEETVGSACSTEGEWNCLGSTYQRCASGVWSAVMDLASGTSCTVGESTSIDIVASSRKEKKRVAMPFRA